MKVISGMNSLRGLEVMRIWEKMEDQDKTDRNRNYLFFLLRSSKAGITSGEEGSVGYK